MEVELEDGKVGDVVMEEEEHEDEATGRNVAKGEGLET